MGFFDREENVNEYIRMAEGFDGRELIKILKGILPAGASVLELGMGPGKDLDMLKKTYTVTGSDLSDIFLERYRKDHPDSDLIKLDAVTLETERKFDCIYSNKVLHHLKKEELKGSFRRQREILNDGGILFHTFWKGEKTEMYDDLLFVQYSEEGLLKIIGKEYDILRMEVYREMEEDDSILLILQRI